MAQIIYDPSLGTLSSNNASFTSVISAFYIGDAGGLYDIPAANVAGVLPQSALPLSNVAAGTYGSANAVPVLTIDSYGRIVSASEANVAASATSNQFGQLIQGSNFLKSGTTFVIDGDLIISGEIKSDTNAGTDYPGSAVSTGYLPIGVIDGSNLAQTLALGTVSANSIATETLSANSVATEALSVSGDITCSYLSAGNLGMFRNRIINGDMRIDQRGSATSPATGNGTYAMDRFAVGMGLTSGSFTISKSALPSPLLGFTSCANITATSVNISGSNNYISIYQQIEGLNVCDLMWGTSLAVPITVSFWIYGVANTYSLRITNAAAGSTRSYVVNFTISASNTWQQVIATVPGDTTGTWTTDNTAGMQLMICFGSSTTFQGPTPNSWLSGNYIATSSTGVLSNGTVYITGVQLEKGSMATPFEFRPYSIEMQMCQRYYQIQTRGNNNGYANLHGYPYSLGNISITEACLITEARTQPSGSTVIYTVGSGSVSGWQYQTNKIIVYGPSSGFYLTFLAVDVEL